MDCTCLYKFIHYLPGTGSELNLALCRERVAVLTKDVEAYFTGRVDAQQFKRLKNDCEYVFAEAKRADMYRSKGLKAIGTANRHSCSQCVTVLTQMARALEMQPWIDSYRPLLSPASFIVELPKRGRQDRVVSQAAEAQATKDVAAHSTPVGADKKIELSATVPKAKSPVAASETQAEVKLAANEPDAIPRSSPSTDVISPSTQWQNFIKDASSNGAIKRLLSATGWLNDIVINDYLGLLCSQRDNIKFVLTSAAGIKLEKNKTWLKASVLDTILMVVNVTQLHWYLLIIILPENKALVYDSLKSLSGATQYQQDWDFIKSQFAGTAVGDKLTKIEYQVIDCPQQKESHCGMYSLVSAEYLTRQPRVEPNFTDENIGHFRLQLFNQLRSGTVVPFVTKSGKVDKAAFDDALALFDHDKKQFLANELSSSGSSPEVVQQLEASQLDDAGKRRRLSDREAKKAKADVSPQPTSPVTEPVQSASSSGQTGSKVVSPSVTKDRPKKQPRLTKVELKVRSLDPDDNGAYLQPIDYTNMPVRATEKYRPFNAGNKKIKTILAESHKYRPMFLCTLTSGEGQLDTEKWIDLFDLVKLKPEIKLVTYMSRIFIWNNEKYVKILDKLEKDPGDKRIRDELHQMVASPDVLDARQQVVTQAKRDASKATYQRKTSSAGSSKPASAGSSKPSSAGSSKPASAGSKKVSPGSIKSPEEKK